MNTARVTHKKILSFQWQNKGSEKYVNLLIIAFSLMVPLLTQEK